MIHKISPHFNPSDATFQYSIFNFYDESWKIPKDCETISQVLRNPNRKTLNAMPANFQTTTIISETLVT